jgi:voltage-gated sodium channel
MSNLFIGVVFDQYNEMRAVGKVQADGKLMRKEDREWEAYRERLSYVKPDPVVYLPTAKWRRRCERLAATPLFGNAILCVIAINAATLAVTHRGQSETFTAVLESSNVVFAMVFALEAGVKVSGSGARRYFADSVNVFDFTVTVVSLLDSALYLLRICTAFDSAALRFVRSMRVFRLMRLVNLAPGCQNVMLALQYALPRLVNVAQLLLIIVFFFANVGWVCFRNFGEHGSRYANFSTVFSSMQLLFVVMTGDNYTDTLGELMEAQPEYKAATVLFFLVYMVVQYFVVVNLFVMVVCEAFEVLSEKNRTTVERFLPGYCKAWCVRFSNLKPASRKCNISQVMFPLVPSSAGKRFTCVLLVCVILQSQRTNQPRAYTFRRRFSLVR